MRTFDLKEAAQFLKLHPEEVRRRAKAGLLPGAKLGKRWGFIEDDLAEYLRSFYSDKRQALRVTLGREEKCHSENVTKSGGSTSSHRMDSEYVNLLGLAIKPKRKNYTTS